jgi:hypothetical protein
MYLLFLLGLLSAYANATITDCGNGASLFQITKLALTPDPPVIGKDIFLTLIFENPDTVIEDGSATTNIAINGIPYPPSSQDLCEATACSISVGTNDRSTSSVWPELSGKIDTTIQWKKPSGELLLCIRSVVKVAATPNLRGNSTIV